MSDVLLATKIHIPSLQGNLVSRPRLIQQLNEGIAQNRRLTLVSAPAGYGKSTLLSDWVSQVGVPVAWLSLEKAENAPVRFWSYLCAGLSTIPHLRQAGISEAISQALQSPQPPPMEGLLANLVTDLAELEERTVLVLDDLHAITEGQIHQELAFLIEHLPRSASGLHLVVASRMDPPWPLARWRVRAELNELRPADLRFSHAEIAQFLNQVWQLGLSPPDILALQERTEGWIAGLQMAAVSMQGRLKAQGPEGISRFIETFTGSHRFILDYLMEEVISQQPADIREFLHRTSILEQFTASLCDAVLERQASQAILEQVEQANLFLISLDDERRWYRYHHLFRELLQQRLKQTVQAAEIKKLHCQASLWFGANKQIIEAVRHALAAEDMPQVVRLIEANIFSMLDRGEIAALIRCLDEIPSELRASHPWLSVAHAWVLAYAGKLELAEELLRAAEQTLNSLEAIEGARAKGYTNTIRAYVSWLRGSGKEAVAFSQQALALLPEKELSVRAFAFKTLGSAHLQCDDLENAYRAYQESIALGRASDNAQVYVLASANLANLFLKRGQLGNVEQICAEVFSFVKNDPAKQTPAIAQIYAMQTDVFWGRYELEKALDTARAGLEICKQWNQLDTLTVCYLSLIDVLITLGNFDEAALELAKLKKLGMNVSAWIKSIIEEEEALLSLAVGDITAAARWAGESGLDYRDVVPETKRTTYRTLAQALWRQGKNTEAVTLLDRLATEAENSGAKGYLLGLLPLQSLVHFSSGNKDQALAVLEQALTLAEPVGYKRMYADLGEPMAKLLHLAIKQAVHPAYAARLVELIEERQARRQGWQWPERESHPAARNKLPEPLSDRELQVLRLLDSPLTGEEISRELYVSVSTTRTHLRNIYGKLGVHGRLEALQKAKALGLI